MATAVKVAMDSNVTRLLRQHLRASAGVWLLAATAVQFQITTATWAVGSSQEFLPGVLLLAVAATRSAPARAMAWQILPISRREVTLARWCAAVLLPALALNGALLLADLNNRSTAWTAPASSSLVLQLAGIWSAFGYLAWIPLRMPLDASPRRALTRILTWAVPLVLAGYGYPLRPGARVISTVIILIGCALLLLSLVRANGGHALPAEKSNANGARVRSAAPSSTADTAARSPLNSSVKAQTAWMLFVGLGGSALLRLLYPHAAQLLLWPFLLTLAIWSTLAAQRWTRSLWMWRCLPLTARRATLFIQGIQLIPLLVTLSAAWALGRLAPRAALPIPGWLPAGTVALVGMANALARMTTRRAGEAAWVTHYLATFIAVSYLSILIDIQPIAQEFIWFPALAWLLSSALVAISYRMTLDELRMADGARGVEMHAIH